MLPMDCVAKIASYLPESDTKEAFDEPVLAAALQQHQERIRDAAGTIHGIQTIIELVNDAIDGPEDWCGRPRHETSGYHKWIMYEYHDYPFKPSDITEDLKLKSLYPKIKQLCASAPVRMQSRLVHHVHNGLGYTVGILWPLLNITLHICEDITLDPESSTEVSRSYQWEKTFPSGNVCSIHMCEQREEYPERFDLTICCSQDAQHEMDAVVFFIETVMSVYPDNSMPEWNLLTSCKMTKKMLQPYKHRLWQYGIEC